MHGINVCAQSLRGQNLKPNGSRNPSLGHVTPDKKADGLGRSSPGSIDCYPRFREADLVFGRYQKAAALALSQTNSYLPA